MARFDVEVGNDLLHQIEKLEGKSDDVFGQMVDAGADVVLRNMRSNMRASFKTTRSLEQGLKKTRVYKTPSDGGVAVKVLFSGYNDKGVAIPLIASARDRGTKRGEAKRPFFRKSFNKSAIEGAMRRVEPRLFEGMQ
jgi:hypothetical protein